MVTLHALLVRRPDLSHEEFLAYWHGTHGPLIRDDPALTRHLLSYHQHPLAPQAGRAGFDGFDGITVQTFPDWEAFWAFATQPEAAAMNADMVNFLDVDRLQVTVTSDPVAVVGPDAPGAGS
jgi:uncharacterized protein (TIGR02118 family)